MDHDDTLDFGFQPGCGTSALREGAQTALSAHVIEVILSCAQPWLVPNMAAFFSILSVQQSRT